MEYKLTILVTIVVIIVNIISLQYFLNLFSVDGSLDTFFVKTET
jgi:hypothetical protein